MEYTMALVLAQEEIAPDIYSLTLRVPFAKEARPGQFISLYSGNGATLLPRPISICQIDAGQSSLRLVYRIAGKGTREFSALKAGNEIRVLGPLGNGFPVEEYAEKRTLLIGGGIGVPPMLSCADALGKPVFAVGYRSKELAYLLPEISAFPEVHIATEDGSLGTQGNVLDAIRADGVKAEAVFACGPAPMLRAVKAWAGEQGIPCFISLEERMACGVGACLGCVTKTTGVDGHSHVKNARICKDGPVFAAEEVDLT